MGAIIPNRRKPFGKVSAVSFARDNFGLLWPVHVDALIELLSRFRTAFDGDLDSAHIMAVIGSAMLPRGNVPRKLSYEEFVRLPPDGFMTKLNTNSISQITRIPRETVRRKTTAMEKRGWLKRDRHGHWKVTRKGIGELQTTTDCSLDYLSTIARTIRSASPN